MADNDEATQPATQLVVDPRRLGHQNSGLNEDDLVDVICILHPVTMPAFQAAAHIAAEYPQHAINRNPHEQQAQGTRPPTKARDIALRLSAKLKNPSLGFQFGRNTQRCDIPMGVLGSGPKRVSNLHFRIYLNEHGTIMLEDQSTNGTKVDDVLLRAKEKKNGANFRHVLEGGMVITLIMTPPEEDIKFVVWIPQREFEQEEEYARNVTKFIQNIKSKDLKPADGKDGARTESSNSLNTSRHMREWKGGSKYNKDKQLGRGAFATVYLLTSRYSGEYFAAKELDKRRFMKNGVLDQKVETELNIMKRIKHDNIVRYIEHVDWNDHIYLIMDYVPEGDLGRLIEEKTRLPELAVRSMTIQLLSVLKYLHGEGITHRDIKPDNILIQRRDPFHVKLTDFGLSKMVESDDTFLRTFCGTLLYCAPEVYSEYREYDANGVRQHRAKGRKGLPPQRYDHAVDIWSLGGVVFYSLAGSPPYPAASGCTYQELLHSIMTKPLDIRPLQRVDVSEEAIDFLKSMLQVRPENRATIDELEQSDWICGRKKEEDPSSSEAVTQYEGAETQLEESASQLSLWDPEPLIDTTLTPENWRPRITIPSSFDTNEASTEMESFSFLNRAAGETSSPRLFGEINHSALGSSGVITHEEQMNVPWSEENSENGSQMDSQDLTITREMQFTNNGGSANEPQRDVSDPARTNGQAPSQGPYTDPSLLGAEALVAQLQVHSPKSLLQSTEMAPSMDAFTVSRRRPHSQSSEDAGHVSKKFKSQRRIDMPVSKSIFWEPKDKSTWHDDYPDLTLSEYAELDELARARGERFTHGQKIFDELIQSHRNSASAEPEAPSRARSEPVLNAARATSLAPPVPPIDRPNSSGGSIERSAESFKKSQLNTAASADFKTPKPIVAKLVATSGSVLPTLTVNVSDTLTSFGRGSLNTSIYANALETRIPKYAFKIFVWNADTNTEATPADMRDKNANFSFWISTKSTQGIHVNGDHVPSSDCKQVCMPSKNWGELRNGDIIQIWSANGQFMNFTFQSQWSKGAAARRGGEPPFTFLNVQAAANLDRACYLWEKSFLDARAQEKEREKLTSGSSSPASGSL